MPHIEQSITIEVSPQEIWDVVSDPERAAGWMPDLKERRLLTHKSADVGTRWRDHGLLHGKPYQAEYEVVVWDPPTRFAYQQVSIERAGYLWIETLSIQATNDGSLTTLHLEYQMPGGLAGKVYEKFIFRKDFRITLENRLEALKELVEAGQSVEAN